MILDLGASRGKEGERERIGGKEGEREDRREGERERVRMSGVSTLSDCWAHRPAM